MDKRELTLGSLFDGSGGFPLGGILAGINKHSINTRRVVPKECFLHLIEV